MDDMISVCDEMGNEYEEGQVWPRVEEFSSFPSINFLTTYNVPSMMPPKELAASLIEDFNILKSKKEANEKALDSLNVKSTNLSDQIGRIEQAGKAGNRFASQKKISEVTSERNLLQDEMKLKEAEKKKYEKSFENYTGIFSLQDMIIDIYNDEKKFSILIQ